MPEVAACEQSHSQISVASSSDLAHNWLLHDCVHNAKACFMLQQTQCHLTRLACSFQTATPPSLTLQLALQQPGQSWSAGAECSADYTISYITLLVHVSISPCCPACSALTDICLIGHAYSTSSSLKALTRPVCLSERPSAKVGAKATLSAPAGEAHSQMIAARSGKRSGLIIINHVNPPGEVALEAG